jgi:hypothetical protein
MTAGTTSTRWKVILELVQIRTNHHRRVTTMTIKLHYITILAAGAAAAAIAAAPTALAAAPAALPVACSSAIPGTSCVTPGNAQLNASLAPDFAPQYPDFSFFGLGRHGGGHR